MFRFFKTDKGDWAAEKVIDIPNKEVEGWIHPVMPGQIFFGGSVQDGGPVTVTKDKELSIQPSVRYAAGKRIEGAPQMLQLSLDGKRLYVTTSLFSPWDKQFYPEMCNKGSMMFIIDVDTKHGGMQLNNDFMVDFGAEPGGP